MSERANRECRTDTKQVSWAKLRPLKSTHTFHHPRVREGTSFVWRISLGASKYTSHFFFFNCHILSQNEASVLALPSRWRQRCLMTFNVYEGDVISAFTFSSRNMYVHVDFRCCLRERTGMLQFREMRESHKAEWYNSMHPASSRCIWMLCLPQRWSFLRIILYVYHTGCTLPAKMSRLWSNCFLE